MKNKKNRYVTKLNLYIRIVVAGYVVYLAYQLIPSIQLAVGSEKTLMSIAAGALGLAGLVIVGLSVKGLICKEYFEAEEIEEMNRAEEDKQSVEATSSDVIPEQHENPEDNHKDATDEAVE